MTDDGGRTEFDGKTIGFCCPGCIEQWNALSDEQKAEKLSAADKKDVPSDADQADHSTHEDHAEHGDEKEPVSE